MAIPKLFQWIRLQELFKQIILNFLPDIVDGLYLDLNGIIHSNAQRVFGYGDYKGKTPPVPVQTVGGQVIVSQAELYKRRFEVFRGVFDDIIRLTRLVGPRQSLVIAVDGVPPEAKIIQQRGRRFESAAGRFPDQVFDPNVINPGTDFMRELDNYIRTQLQEVINLGEGSTKIPHPYAGVLPPHVLYSSHLVPGEGEHKIADHMRTVAAQGQTAVIYGMDADLIMIYLLHLGAGWDNIYLFREGEFKGRPQINVVDLKRLGQIIRNLYPGVPAPLEDFVTLLFLLGNDFLPHFPVFDRTHDSLQTLIFGYRQYLNENPGKGLCTPDGIDWSNFGSFCSYVGDHWNSILLTQWATNPDNLIKFPSAVAERCITKVTVVKGNQQICQKQFDVPKFKDEWYKYIFSPKTGLGVIVPILEDKQMMINAYLEGVAWVHRLYTRGVSDLNVGWYYPFHYAPDFTDIGPYVIERQDEITWEVEPLFMKSDFVSVFEQMLQVMPPKSIQILPEVLRPLYSEASPIFDLTGIETFVTDTGGKQEEWQGIPILPFPDPLRIRWTVDRLGIPEAYLEQFGPEENLVIIQDINKMFRAYGGQRARGRGRGAINPPRGGYVPRGGRGGRPPSEGRGGYVPRGGRGASRGGPPSEGRGGYIPRGGRGVPRGGPPRGGGGGYRAVQY